MYQLLFVVVNYLITSDIKILIIFLAVFLSSNRLYSEELLNRSVDDIVFKLAVIGPSEKISSWGGHTLMVEENKNNNFSRSIDFGIAVFNSNKILIDKSINRIYASRVFTNIDFGPFFNEDRDIVLYTLDFDVKGKIAILNYVENLVRPENRFYKFHIIRNNCSTGMRDLINIGTHGQLENYAKNIFGRMSIRSHINRFTWRNDIYSWLFDLLLGQTYDEIPNVWNEMFLPSEIAYAIDSFYYTDATGNKRKLLVKTEILNSSKTFESYLQSTKKQWVKPLILSLIIATLLFIIKIKRHHSRRIYGIIWGVINSITGLILGFSGCILFLGYYFWSDYVQYNINILFINPLLIIIFPIGIFIAIGNTICHKTILTNKKQSSNRYIYAETILKLLWTYVFLAGIVSMVVKVLPMFYQQNQAVVCLVLPIAFVLSIIPEVLRNAITVKRLL